MFKSDNIFIGLILGFALPVLGAALALFFFEQFGEPDDAIQQRRTCYVIGICFNFIPFRWFTKKRWSKSMRGVLLATLVCAGVWIFYFGSALLQG